MPCFCPNNIMGMDQMASPQMPQSAQDCFYGQQPSRKANKKKPKGYKPPQTPPGMKRVVYEPCVHLHFKPEHIDRECLTREQYYDMLATPKGYPWLGEADCQNPELEVKSKSKKKKKQKKSEPEECVPRADAGDFGDEFVEDMWDVMSPEITCRLIDFLVNEFGMSVEEAEDFIDCKSCVGKQNICKKKKSKTAIGLGPKYKWVKEFSDVFSKRIEQYIISMLQTRRTPRTKRIAEKILQCLCDLTGEKTTLQNPKTTIQKIMVLIADRLALWIDDMMNDIDKPHKRRASITEEDEVDEEEGEEEAEEEEKEPPKEEEKSEEQEEEKPEEKEGEKEETPQKEEDKEDEKVEELKKEPEPKEEEPEPEKEEPKPEEEKEEPKPEPEKEEAKPEPVKEEPPPPKDEEKAEEPAPQEQKEDEPPKVEEKPEEPPEEPPQDKVEEPVADEAPAEVPADEEPKPAEETEEPPVENEVPPQEEVTAEPTEEEAEAKETPVEEEIPVEDEKPTEAEEPQAEEEKVPEEPPPEEPEVKEVEKEREAKPYGDVFDLVKEDIEGTPKDRKTDRQKADKDEVIRRIEKHLAGKDLDIQPDNIDDAASRVAHWMEHVLGSINEPTGVRRKTPSPAYGVNPKDSSTLEVQKLSSGTVAQNTAKARGVPVPPRERKVPETTSPMNLQSTQEWFDWANNIGNVADEWGKWLESKLTDAEKQIAEKKKAGPDYDFKQWRDQAQTEAHKWRVEKEKIKGEGKMWDKKIDKKLKEQPEKEVRSTDM